MTNVVAQNSLYSLLSFGAPLVLMLLFTPLLIHTMGLETYGLWTIALAGLGLMGVVEFGLDATIAKYVAEYVSKNEVEGLSATITIGFSAYFVIALLLIVPLYLLSPQLATFFQSDSLSPEQVRYVIRLVSLGLIPMMIKNAVLAVPRGLQQFDVLTGFELAQNVLSLVVALVIAWLHGSVYHIILGTITVLCVIAVLGMRTTWRILKQKQVYVCYSGQYARKILWYSMFTGISGIGQRMFTTMDRILVGAVLGFSAVSYYTICIGMTSKLLAFSGTITRSLMPAASSWQADGEHHRLWQYLAHSTWILTIANAVMATILIVFSEPFLRLWINEDFVKEALISFRILIIIYALLAICSPSYQIANGIGIPWITALGALVGGGLTILLIAVWGKSWGLAGAAWANAGYLINFVMVAYTMQVVWQKNRLSS